MAVVTGVGVPEAFFDKDVAETIAKTAGIISALIAVAFGLWKYRKNRRNQVGDHVRETYRGFMKLALECSEFFPGCWSRIQSDPVQRNRFEWFIAHFLWCCEDILMHDPKDLEGYVAGMRNTILEHRDYFSSDAFVEQELSTYGLPLRGLIATTLRGAGAAGCSGRGQ